MSYEQPPHGFDPKQGPVVHGLSESLNLAVDCLPHCTWPSVVFQPILPLSSRIVYCGVLKVPTYPRA